MSDASDTSDTPGRLRLVEELLNTYDVESGRDAIAAPADAGRWLAQRELSEGRVPRAGVAELQQLREALRGLALANNGEPLDPSAPATLNRLSARCPLVVTVDRRGRPSVLPAAGGFRGAIGALLAIVHAAAADGTWPRLKACRNDTCRWAFYDRSRNRSGAWCDMAVCGNRAKVRAYRRRH